MIAIRRSGWVVSFAMVVLALQAPSRGQLFRNANRPPGPGGVINLPYMVSDNTGNQWRLYQGGYFQQQGNRPVYSQAGMLTINGNSLNINSNVARLDEKTGEVVFPDMAGNGVVVTRRVLVDKERSLVRYADVIKNTSNQEQTFQVSVQTSLNYGVNTSAMVPDPKRREQPLAWVAQTGAGVSVVEMYAGKGTKTGPQIIAPPGNSSSQAIMPITLGPGKEGAFVHIHATVMSQEAGINFVNEFKESDMLRSLSREVRKIVVNFRGGQTFINDLEVLRGDILDVVELKSGDQFRGTLKEPSFALQTFYGAVRLPVEQVVGLMNVGRFRPRQLIVTADGQIFGGTLDKDTIALELTSGQVTQIPLAQITRLGYRKREGEPEEWTFEKPMVLLRSGERVCVELPKTPIDVQTRYGKLSLPPSMIASVSLQSEEHGAHEIQLVDGSKFTGLLSAEQFEMALEGAGAIEAANDAARIVKFPVSTIARLQFKSNVAEESDSAPAIELANEDLLVGTLTGQLKVDTAFDTITVNASEIKSLAHPALGSLDVVVTLWDGTTLGGQLQNSVITARLGAGLEMTVAVSLLVRYEQPQPQPSAQMVEQIQGLIVRLNDENWRERDRAEAQLLAMGPVAIGTLKSLRASQPPTSQQRIDAIVKQLEKVRSEEKKTSSKNNAPNPLLNQTAENAQIMEARVQIIEALEQIQHIEPAEAGMFVPIPD